MRMLTLGLLFFSSICFANADLIIGSNSAEVYRAEVPANNPMQLLIQHLQTRKTEIMSFKNSVSDLNKLTIQKSNAKKPKELLLVVLAVSDKEQAVIVLDLAAEKKTLCSFRNEGDFSWTSDQDLAERVRFSVKGKTESLQIKIGNRSTGSTKFSWSDCASI
jgi:hypothetical protein